MINTNLILYRGRTYSGCTKALGVPKMEGCFSLAERFICKCGSPIRNTGRVIRNSGTLNRRKLLMPKVHTLNFASVSIIIGELLVLFSWRTLDNSKDCSLRSQSSSLKLIWAKAKLAHLRVTFCALIQFWRQSLSPAGLRFDHIRPAIGSIMKLTPKLIV